MSVRAQRDGVSLARGGRVVLRDVTLTVPAGTFVGLVLGGASPAEAARVQLVVLLALLTVQLVAALTCARLVVAGLTLPGERVATMPAV